MKLEHFGMAEPGDCRVVFSASAAELEAAVQAEQAAPDAPADEDEEDTEEDSSKGGKPRKNIFGKAANFLKKFGNAIIEEEK